MDNVGSAEAQKHLHKIRMIHSAGVIKGTHNMGADDKVGIFIALELYKTFGNKISLLFTIQEETGGWGSESFDKSLIKDNTYCVVPDRYGTSDIIGYNNDYCTKEFEDIVAYHLNIFGFYPATGVRCDADKLQSSINCINISCGYYQHHTDQEYVDWSATKNTIAALDHLIRL
jgi:tripeptide aminopeptidase